MSLQPYPGNAGWPSDWQGSRFTGKFLTIAGVPINGSVTFTPTATAVVSGSSKTIIIGATVSVPLVEGAFDIVLPASDDPDMNPTGWTYQVVENFPGGRKYHVAAPVNATQDLSALSPLSPANGVTITRGKSAYEVAVDNGFVGTEAQWVASLGGDMHTHTIAEVINLQAALDSKAPAGSYVSSSELTAALAGKADTGHTHTIANTTGLQAALDGKQPAGSYALTSDLAGKANTGHTHTIADTTGLQAALDGKQPSGSYATTTALTTGLAGKANSSHAHATSDVTGLDAALAGVQTGLMVLEYDWAASAWPSRTTVTTDRTKRIIVLGPADASPGTAPIETSGAGLDLPTPKDIFLWVTAP